VSEDAGALDAAAVGEDAGAVDAAAVGEGAGAVGEAAGGWEPPAEQTPAAADARGAEHAEGPPFVPIAGAFVGAFVAAKLLGKLGGGDD
jgi:hypothetical protein